MNPDKFMEILNNLIATNHLMINKESALTFITSPVVISNEGKEILRKIKSNELL